MSSVRSTAAATIPQAPVGGTAADSSRAAIAFPARRFLAALVAVVGAGVLLIAGANYFLDPLHFSASGQRQVAAVLLSGKNYAVFRREHGFSRAAARGDRANDPDAAGHSVRGQPFSSWRRRTSSPGRASITASSTTTRSRISSPFPDSSTNTSACRKTSC